jgi:hypothetical protein
VKAIHRGVEVVIPSVRYKGKEENNMDWSIQTKDGTTRYPTYEIFLDALRARFGDPKHQFISATLDDGTVLDEAAARKLIGGFGIGEGVIGETPI